MGPLSPKQCHEVNAVLRDDLRLPPPAELDKFPERHGGDDILKRALEENAVLKKEKKSLRQKLDVSQIENKARGQKLTAGRRERKSLEQKFSVENQSLRQKLDVSEKERKSLEQKLSAFQNESKERGQKLGAARDENKSLGQKELDMRQLFNYFRGKGDGKKFDKGLWKKACEKFPEYFDTCVDCYGKAIYTFSGMVIQLLKEKKDLNLSSNCCSEIKRINIKLATLKGVAGSFQKPEMKWDGALCTGFFFWCLLVADVNKACHRDMTKELLLDMGKRAARGEYRYGEEDLGPAVQAAIRQLNLENSIVGH